MREQESSAHQNSYARGVKRSNDGESFVATIKESLFDSVLGPLDDYVWRIDPCALIALAWLLVIIQLATFFGFGAYYYKSSLETPFISAESGDGGGTRVCEQIPKFVNGNFYATLDGRWLTSNADPEAFLEFSFTNFQAESLSGIFDQIHTALFDLAKKTKNNLHVYNHITLYTWEKIYQGESGTMVVRLYSSPITDGSFITPSYMGSTLKISRECSLAIFQGKVGKSFGRSGLAIEYFTQLTADTSQSANFLPPCYSVDAASLFGNFRSSSRSGEYEYKVTIQSVATALAVNMGIIEVSILTKLQMNSVIAPPQGINLYSLSKYFDDPEKSAILCAVPSEMDDATLKRINITRSFKPLCTVLTGTIVPIIPLLPTISQFKLDQEYIGKVPIPAPFCTCESSNFKLNVSKLIPSPYARERNESFVGNITDPCGDGTATASFNLIGRPIIAYLRPQNTSYYFPLYFAHYYNLVYTEERPDGDYHDFMNNVSNSVWLRDYYESTDYMNMEFNLADQDVWSVWMYQFWEFYPFTTAYSHFNNNTWYTFNASAVEKAYEALEYSAATLGYFDFCKDKDGNSLGCDLLIFQVANLYGSINDAGYVYTNGNCNNVFGIEGSMTEVDDYLRKTTNKLMHSSRPFRLVEEYYTCTETPRSSLLKAFPLSASMIQTVTAVYIFVFLPLFVYLLTKCRSGRKLMRFKYSAEELKVASTELSLHLLRSRDNDTFGITPKGTLDNLSRELLTAALYTGGFVDSDDDVDIDEYMERRGTSNKSSSNVKKNKDRRFSARMSSSRLVDPVRLNEAQSQGDPDNGRVADTVPPPGTDSSTQSASPSPAEQQQAEEGLGIQLRTINPFHDKGTL